MEVLDLEKKNALLNLIKNEPDIDKIYLYAQDPYKAKYQLLINKRESTSLKYLNDSKAFIEHWNDMDNIDKNIEKYNPNKKRKKFQTEENFKKFNLIIHQILTFKTLWIFAKTKLQNLIFFAYWYYSCTR